MATSVAPRVLLSNPSSLPFNRRAPSKFPPPAARAAAELGFLSSQLGGVRIYGDLCRVALPKPIVAPFVPALKPVVARRVCPFTGKKPNKANKVSFSNKKTIKRQFVNLQYKKIWWEAGKRYVKLRLSTKAMKTIEKNGLDAVAKKAGIDLRKE